MTANTALRSTAQSLRTGYSERRLASMNGYAMVAIAIVLAGVAASRFLIREALARRGRSPKPAAGDDGRSDPS